VERFAILRFSDAEGRPTISEHNKILATGSPVWWGWWKKQTETFPLDFLRYLKLQSNKQLIRIGLVKRKEEEELSVATCSDVSFREDGERISSPEPALTPPYYRDEPCPAWFRFTQIQAIARGSFLREFGFVPASDPTFYEVRWDEQDKFDIHPRHDWSMAVVEAPGDAILHLSDLHFGDDHGFSLGRGVEGEALDRPSLAEIISERLARELRIQIGVVVVSGDLITRGDGNAYAHARAFLEHLLPRLQLDSRHCVIVPGNHDLWTIGVDHPTREYRHERNYRDFVGGFFGNKLQELERVRRYRTPNGFELVFIELNSARLRSDVLRDYGYVSKHRYSELLRYVTEVLKQDKNKCATCIKFAVLHHHLMPVGAVAVPDDKKPVSLCLDAGELIEEFQTHGIQFVLHGHEHVPFVGTVSRVPDRNGNEEVWHPNATNQVFVLASGSSGARRDRLPPEPGLNTFGVYVPTTDAMRVTIEQYDQMRHPQPLLKVSLPIN
jgi:predicted MPP superfamily phosphohydrolase